MLVINPVFKNKSAKLLNTCPKLGPIKIPTMIYPVTFGKFRRSINLPPMIASSNMKPTLNIGFV